MDNVLQENKPIIQYFGLIQSDRCFDFQCRHELSQEENKCEDCNYVCACTDCINYEVCTINYEVCTNQSKRPNDL